jgi:hypothetical protein
MICHGQGTDPVAHSDPFDDGCCFIAGQPCQNRWYLDYSTCTPPGNRADVANATVYEGANRTISVGSVDDLARSFVGNNPNRRQRIFDQVQGALYICKVAALVIEAGWGSGPPDRATFEAAWAAHPDYQPVADAWEAIGKPRDWCALYGPSEGQCCHREDQATNDARRANLTTTAVTVRAAATGAS